VAPLKSITPRFANYRSPGKPNSGRHYVRKTVELPILPLGYHDLEILVGALALHAAHCWLPIALIFRGPARRRIAIALYGVARRTNWGCGDFRDLRAVMTGCR